jgi:feruloyl-CoA synthase
MNIASHLDRWAAGTPLKTALWTTEGELTYTELNFWSSGITAQLAALRLVKGDRVGVLAGSNAELVAALYGTWKLGAIAVLLNPQLARATSKGRPCTPGPA